MNNLTSPTIDGIRHSRGRFFGLTTYDGRVFNARYVRETPHYINIWDRNSRKLVKILKNNVRRASGIASF